MGSLKGREVFGFSLGCVGFYTTSMFAAVKRYSREIDSGPGKAGGPEWQRTDWSGREFAG